MTGRTEMRAFVVALLGVIGGFLGGIVLAELVGLVGFALLDDVSGLGTVRFLPFALAAGCGIAAPVVDARLRRRAIR